MLSNAPYLLPNRQLSPAGIWLNRLQLGHSLLHTGEQLVAPVDGTWTRTNNRLSAVHQCKLFLGLMQDMYNSGVGRLST